MSHVSMICFFSGYLVAFVVDWMRLLGRITLGRAIMLLFGAAGFAAHTLYLLNRATQANLPPLLSSTHDWLLVLAWMIVLFVLFLAIVDRKLPVGLFLLPLVLLLIGAAYVVSDIPSTMAARDPVAGREVLRRWALLHTSLLTFGFGGVIVGFVLSLMYLVQHRRLKHKQAPQGGLTLPSLARLARCNWWAIVVAVPLLTLGMLSGIHLIYLTRTTADPISFGDPIVMASGIVWLVMMAFFGWLLWTPRPAGKQVAWLTLWAFGFLLVTLLGLQVLTGGHEAAGGSLRREVRNIAPGDAGGPAVQLSPTVAHGLSRRSSG